MSYTRSTLPTELVLNISNNIKNWQDRYQFALTSRHHWHCIIKSYSLREVHLKDERNLLKIKVARSFVLSLGLRAERDVSKAVRFLTVCAKLRDIVITGSITATSQIEKILRAASQRDRMHSISIAVTPRDYNRWSQVLDKQKFKAGVINLTCDIIDDDEDASTTTTAANNTAELNLEEYMASVKYKKCAYSGRSQELTAQNSHAVALELGSYFVGSIVCFDQIKILIASLDIFFHIENIDDCAYTNQWLDETVFSKLHMKSERGNNFFELSLIVDGCIELLVVGGLAVINGGSAEPFLGSSVKPLNRAKVLDGDLIARKIFVPTNPKATIQTERLLRQYYKRDSCKPWSFHLEELYSIGFHPIHPLHAGDHPSISSLPLTIQSDLLRLYALRRIDRSLLALMFNAIRESSMIEKECKLLNFTGTSFFELYNAMTISGK
ncbi:hypothetical protein V8B55DRAFT_1340734 [Mucor lusitanicus]|uniref:Uncharacterized protein n=2 Tax=Mucor circinelloides f. lusitanicus TaxID=29924 RepID=A0A168QGJ3_MUCCL|nr:hypothetical protein FB192DRAFT_1472739 [Mucor lusitanicus]OAD09205.1 hypothetical protein MUCCIDRAFT_106189 [Mucor lusitanicus CBS 277.49]